MNLPTVGAGLWDGALSLWGLTLAPENQNGVELLATELVLENWRTGMENLAPHPLMSENRNHRTLPPFRQKEKWGPYQK